MRKMSPKLTVLAALIGVMGGVSGYTFRRISARPVLQQLALG